MKKSSKINYKIIIISVFVAIPLLLYFYKFHQPLSREHSDWGSFGSYFGGIYTSIFSFVTILILIKTLRESRRQNREQNESIQTEQTINNIVTLSNTFRQLFNSNSFFSTPQDVKQFSDFMNRNAKAKCIASSVRNEDDILKICNQYCKEQGDIFSDEINLLLELFYRIDLIEDGDLKDLARTIVKGTIRNDVRFWLKCSMHSYSPVALNLLTEWPDFARIPIPLSNTLPHK